MIAYIGLTTIVEVSIFSPACFLTIHRIFNVCRRKRRKSILKMFIKSIGSFVVVIVISERYIIMFYIKTDIHDNDIIGILMNSIVMVDSNIIIIITIL